jgi:Sulfotransferase domain
MLKVVGAGVGRTGTHSLKVVLEKLLGGPCHHMVEVFAHPDEVPIWTDAIDGKAVDWTALMAPYVAQVDWPGCSFWPELTAANPEALVILSVRDPDSWYTSCSNTIFAGIGQMVEQGDPWMTAMLRLLGTRFSDQVGDRDAMVAAFERHNDEVRAGVPKERLLEWQAGDGWKPICERLGVAVPDEPFPVTNTTEEFREMMGMPPVDA